MGRSPIHHMATSRDGTIKVLMTLWVVAQNARVTGCCNNLDTSVGKGKF